jgi:hypothetical protein
MNLIDFLGTFFYSKIYTNIIIHFAASDDVLSEDAVQKHETASEE